MNVSVRPAEVVPLSIGYYTVPEASRLLRIAPRTINRWFRGYRYEVGGKSVPMPPLWTPELPASERHLKLSFRDLIELRFAKAFVQAGVGLKAFRACRAYAREWISDERPFSTRRFQTDGRTIFLASARRAGTAQALDLEKYQFVIKDVIARTFKDLDIEGDAVARWRPFRGKPSIVIDPRRAFGQPIAASSGVPTVVLADAARAEGSVQRAAAMFEVEKSVVHDAIDFEESLAA